MRMNNEPLRIDEIVEEGKDIRTFLFARDFNAKPGMFVQIGIPDYGVKPFSASYENGITMRKIKRDPSNPLVGKFTNKAFELEEGDRMWITGPSGRGFPVENFNDREVCLVGGGTGIAPLAFLNEKIQGSEVMSFLGAKTSDEVIMEDRFEKPVITTDDGSRGHKGFVTEILEWYDRYLGRLGNKARVAMCGPEKMMKKTTEILGYYYIPARNIYLSVERLMKCGIGLCGACDFGGYRTCVDGSVFTYKEIKDVDDFGKFKRDRCGRKEFFQV